MLMTSACQQMGFDGLMIGRISRDVQRRWEASRHMEFVWLTDPFSQRPEADLFTWVPPYSYTTPGIFCLDVPSCRSPMMYESIQDMPHYLLLYSQYQTEVYTPSNIAIMFGGDLSYVEAEKQFAAIDALAAAANALDKAKESRWRRYRLKKAPVHVFYSTPACFLRALHEVNVTWPVFSNDVLPYTDSPGRTWSGFYTSRPSLKLFARYANGVLQHHDGITGTSTHEVAQDYANQLSRGIASCELAVVVYNPDTESLLTYVRLPVGRDIQLVVTDPDGLELEHQVLPVAPHRLGVPERTSTAPSEIVFPALVPPLGMSVYKMEPGIPAPNVAKTGSVRDDFLELEQQLDYRYRLELDPTSGLVTRVHLLGRNLSLGLRQSFAAYLHEFSTQAELSESGHYVFSAYRNAYQLDEQVAYRVLKASSSSC
ncbi:lysosomal alpha-mannosidase, putative, partial [Ixodes scapularis]